MAQNDISSRLEGIDLARFISLLGMILINFSIFAGVSETKPGFIASIINAFEGKAAALCYLGCNWVKLVGAWVGAG